MKLLNVILKSAIRLFLLLIGAYFIFINLKLYHQPSFKKANETEITYNEDVYHQLKHLKTKLSEGAGSEMQGIFPEGFIFINSLYALTWIDFLANQSKVSKIYKEGMNEISWVLEEIKTEEAKSIFTKDLPLKYGAFYTGWTNYVLGKKLKIQSTEDREFEEVNRFKQNCEAINKAIANNRIAYLESYKGQKWPADGIIAASSLSLHDAIFQTNTYEKTMKDWLKKIKRNLDPKTGLIPHSVSVNNDETIEGARGSSQSLILIFLKDIDPDFAEEQFQKFRKLFLDYRFGLPGIREYPYGESGAGDIDSGPVLLGIGGAASIVGQRTMGLYGDWSIYKGLRNSIESFGLGMTFNAEKKYLFGGLPMADAFIAWSNSIENSKIEVPKKEYSPFIIHSFSFLILAFLGLLIYKI